MVLAALNSAVEPAAAAAPAPTATMQYTYQSLVEVGRTILMSLAPELNIYPLSTRQNIKNAVASPTIFESIIGAFENQRRQERLRTGAESVL